MTIPFAIGYPVEGSTAMATTGFSESLSIALQSAVGWPEVGSISVAVIGFSRTALSSSLFIIG